MPPSTWIRWETSSQLEGIQSIADAAQWLGLASPARAAILVALGHPILLRQIVLIPAPDYAAATAAIEVPGEPPAAVEGVAEPPPPSPGRPLNSLERVHIVGLRRIARLRVGFSPEESGSAGATAPGLSQDSAASQGGVLPIGGAASLGGIPNFMGQRKVKLALAIDQADDSETVPLKAEGVRKLIEDFKEFGNDGEELPAEEEPQGDQLTALKFRLDVGATLFADFGIWRPFFTRLNRMLKFTAYFSIPAGGFQTKEFAGPPSLDEWSKSWRVFATAMLILKAASRARLDRYAAEIATLSSTFPGMWWLIALADGRMRGEQFERLRRRAQKEHEELRAAGFNPRSRRACRGTRFSSWRPTTSSTGPRTSCRKRSCSSPRSRSRATSSTRARALSSRTRAREEEAVEAAAREGTTTRRAREGQTKEKKKLRRGGRGGGKGPGNQGGGSGGGGQRRRRRRRRSGRRRRKGGDRSQTSRRPLFPGPEWRAAVLVLQPLEGGLSGALPGKEDAPVRMVQRVQRRSVECRNAPAGWAPPTPLA